LPRALHEKSLETAEDSQDIVQAAVFKQNIGKMKDRKINDFQVMLRNTIVD
jgi:hypothetical protein